MAPITIAVLAFTLLLQFEFSQAIECYSCVSPLGEHADCEVDVNRTAPIKCSGDDICLEFAVQGFKASLLVRSCAPRASCQNLNNIFIDDLIMCNICTKDLCNYDSPNN